MIAGINRKKGEKKRGSKQTVRHVRVNGAN